MTAKVPTSETGTATLGMRVARTLRRKTKTTSVTRITEISSVRSTSRSEARMVVVRSSTTLRSMAPGMAALRRGISATTRSTVSMMLAPGWRKMITSTDGRPLARPRLRTSSTESTTLATSRSSTGRPLV